MEQRSIPGQPGYTVTRDGVIRGPRGWSLKPWAGKWGHLRVYCYQNRQRTIVFVHRAVLAAWGPPQPDANAVGRHLNGDPTDNRIENLTWGTHSENALDAYRHGTRPQGEACDWSKLTRRRVKRLRRALDRVADAAALGQLIGQLARRYGVARATVWSAWRARTWKTVS